MQYVTRVSTRLQREGWRLEEPLPHAHRWTSPLGQTLHVSEFFLDFFCGNGVGLLVGGGSDACETTLDGQLLVVKTIALNGFDITLHKNIL